MTVIELNKKVYTVPTSWNELSQQQLLQIMDCLFVKQYSSAQIILSLLRTLCNMNYFQFFRCSAIQLEEFLYLTEFLFDKEPDFSKQLLPRYDGMYGPDSGFNNLVMSEFTFSEDWYLKYCENKKDTRVLDLLCATLYRPSKKDYDFKRNPDGDPRTEFNENVCAYMAATKVASWPVRVKMAIMAWYGSCRLALVRNNPDVFSGGGDPAKYGLVSVMMAVAKRGVLGDFNSVEKKYVNLVMMDLNESIREAREMERASKVK